MDTAHWASLGVHVATAHLETCRKFKDLKKWQFWQVRALLLPERIFITMNQTFTLEDGPFGPWSHQECQVEASMLSEGSCRSCCFLSKIVVFLPGAPKFPTVHWTCGHVTLLVTTEPPESSEPRQGAGHWNKYSASQWRASQLL